MSRLVTIALLALAVVARADAPRPDPWADPDAAPRGHATRSRASSDFERMFGDYVTVMLGSVSVLRHYEHERVQQVDATRSRLDALVDRVDQLIAARQYEAAKLEASKIRWPYHESKDDEGYARDYDALRDARMGVIDGHLRPAK